MDLFDLFRFDCIFFFTDVDHGKHLRFNYSFAKKESKIMPKRERNFTTSK